MEIDNFAHSQFATGKFNLYFLHGKPHGVSPMMYGNGLPKEYSGLRIQINENTK